MVKKVWVLIALVAGLVAGIFLATYGAYVLGFSNAEAEGWYAQVAAKRCAALAPVTCPAAAGEPAHPAPAHTAPGSTQPDTVALVETHSISSTPGGQVEFKDPLHEQFLREERDDSWAYLREAELENSMLLDLSEGKFRKDRIECRASICEVDLSATGEQVAKLSQWMEEKNRQRGLSFDEPLMMRGASFSGNDNRGQARITYVNPRRFMPVPKKD